MKSVVNRILLTLVVGAMVSSVAFAKTRRETVTLTENVTINGTLVKSGTYDVAFNDETNELSILKKGKVVAKTGGRIEQRSSKASRTEVKTITTSGGVEFVGVTFNGSDKDIMVQRADAAKN